MSQTMRSKWAAGLLGVLLLAGCEHEPEEMETIHFTEGRPYREKYVGTGERVRGAVEAGECTVFRTCGDFAYIDCRSAVDGPAYYVHSPTWQVLEICGGACMGGGDEWCVACPPPEWTCQ